MKGFSVKTKRLFWILVATILFNFVVFLYFTRVPDAKLRGSEGCRLATSHIDEHLDEEISSKSSMTKNEGKEENLEIHSKRKVMVGFLQMVTGKYTKFINQSHQSFLKHMFDESFDTHDYRIVYFTDQTMMFNLPKAVYVSQERLQWPYDSMNRNDVYLANRHVLESFDYLIALDIDLVWVSRIDPELILNDFITLRHLAFKERGEGQFENRPESQAFTPKILNNECHYIMGGFFGGKKDVFFRTLETIWKWKKQDEENNIVPRWHDESYLNRYVCENYEMGQKDITFLKIGFLNIEGRVSNITKIMHLNKNHKEIRDLV